MLQKKKEKSGSVTWWNVNFNSYFKYIRKTDNNPHNVLQVLHLAVEMFYRAQSYQCQWKL